MRGALALRRSDTRKAQLIRLSLIVCAEVKARGMASAIVAAD